MRTLVLEGLPGGGKTSLASQLSKERGLICLDEHIFIPEVFQLFRDSDPDNDYIYEKNWEIKCQIAKMIGQDCVFDRNHITLLAYNYAKSEFLGDPTFFKKAIKWYQKALDEGLIFEPDVYVVLHVAPNLCNERKKRCQTPSDIWTNPDILKLSGIFYRNLQDFLPRDVAPQIINLDTSQPFNVVRENVREIIYG